MRWVWICLSKIAGSLRFNWQLESRNEDVDNECLQVLETSAALRSEGTTSTRVPASGMAASSAMASQTRTAKADTGSCPWNIVVLGTPRPGMHTRWLRPVIGSGMGGATPEPTGPMGTCERTPLVCDRILAPYVFAR